MIIKKLRSKKFSASDVNDVQLNPEEENKRFTKFLYTSFIVSMRDTAKETAQLFGLYEAEVTDEQIIEYLRQSIKKFSQETTNTTNTALAKSLFEGIEEGDTMNELADRVYNIFQAADETRATMIARSELTRVSTWTNEQLYKNAGIQYKQWLTNPGACQFCNALSGKIVKIDSTFGRLGSTVDGTQGGEYQIGYDTLQRPPLHPSCRCDLMPVV